VLGGLIGWLVVRDRDARLGRRILFAGTVVTGVGVAASLVLALAVGSAVRGIGDLTPAPSHASTSPTQVGSVAPAAGCPSDPRTPLAKPQWANPPAMTLDTTKSWTATVTTDVGSFTIALDAKNTPLTVNNFVFLARQHFYDCITFHRVIPGFMDQSGDPTGSGSGGPGYRFPDELPPVATPQYPVGAVAMANAGPDTNGSQFFVVAGTEGTTLPPNYSLFGSVVSGMSVAEHINNDGNNDPSQNGEPPRVIHRILSISITEG